MLRQTQLTIRTSFFTGTHATLRPESFFPLAPKVARIVPSASSTRCSTNLPEVLPATSSIRSGRRLRSLAYSSTGTFAANASETPSETMER